MISSRSFFVDTTLRDGMQAPGMSISSKFRESLIDRLVDSGFTELEAGIPAAGRHEWETLRSVKNRSIRSIAWCRALGGDINSSEKVGTGAVHIAFPMSPEIQGAIGWDRYVHQEKIESLIARARIGHNFVSAGFMDCFRSDMASLISSIHLAFESGAHRVRLADSVGIGTPDRLRILTRKLEPQDLERIEFHGHDDLGLALANGLEALSLGFGGVSGTVAGIGERAGNLAWERLAMVYRDLGFFSLNPRKLVETALALHEETGRRIPPRTPVIGSACRTHESGIHASAHYRDPEAFRPWNPEQYGLPSTQVVAGSSSGRGGLVGMLNEAGIEPGKTELSNLVEYLHHQDSAQMFSIDDLATLYLSISEMSA